MKRLLLIAALFSTCAIPFTSLKTAAQVNDIIPQHDSLILYSQTLKESRHINIWTPPGYAESTTPFMVMYMPDGGIQEDFPHVANTLSALIAAKKIPQMILVGIANTQRRRDLTGPSDVKKDSVLAPLTDGAADFRAFVRDELFPEINKRYRISGKKAIIGESLAGLFVIETFMLQPDMFDYYIAMDPSLWWNSGYLVKTANTHLTALPEQEKRLWFAGSHTKDIYKYTRPLSKELEKQNLPQLKWHYSDEPGEKHNTIYRATKEKALIWTFSIQ